MIVYLITLNNSMASDSNSVVDHSVVEGDHMGDHHSTDLKQSNISQQYFSEGDNKSTSLDHSSEVSTTDLTIAANEPEISLTSTSHDTVSKSCENNLHGSESVSKEDSIKVEEISSENQIVSPRKNFNGKPFNEIQPGPIEEKDMSETTQTILFEETKSIKIIPLTHSEENESSKVIQKVFPEDNESSQVILPTPAKETVSTQEIHSAFIEEIQVTISQENELTVSTQPALAKENKSIPNDEPVFSEKTGLTQITQQEYSEETESAPVIMSGCSNKTESTQEIHVVLAEDSLSNEVAKSSVSEQTELTGKIKHVLEEDCVSSEVTESSVSVQTGSNQEIQGALEENVSTEVIQSSASDQAESTTVIQQALEEDSLSTEVIRSSMSMQTESSPVIQQANLSTKEIESSISVQTESTPEILPILKEDSASNAVAKSTVHVKTEEIPTPVSDKSTCTIATKPILSEKTESSKLIKVSHLEKTKPTEVNDVTLDKEFPLDSSEPICSSKSLVASSVFENYQLQSHAAVNTYGVVTVDQSYIKPLKIDIDACSNQQIYDSFFQSPDSFRALLDTEEYKNGSHYVIPGKGQVIVPPRSPLPPPDPFFAKLYSNVLKDLDLENLSTESPLSPSIRNPLLEPIKNSSPPKDPTVPKDASLDRSLSALLPLLANWVQRVVEKSFCNLDQPKLEDFVDYCRTELKSGIDILKEMLERVNSLIRAALFLPDPTSFPECESESGKVSSKVCLVEVAFKVQQKVKVLEAKTTENYNMLDELKPSDAALSTEYVPMQRGMKAKNMFLNLFVELSEDVLTLTNDVKDFRERIREFCFELENSL